MIRRTRMQKGLGAKAGAVILSAAMAFSSLSAALPGGNAIAETGEDGNEKTVSAAEASEAEKTGGEAGDDLGGGASNQASSLSSEAEGNKNSGAEMTSGTSTTSETTTTSGTNKQSDAGSNDAGTTESEDGKNSATTDSETGKTTDGTDGEDTKSTESEADAEKVEDKSDAADAEKTDETEETKEAAKALLTSSETDSESAPSRDFDDSKTDVWDFGAEDLGDSYNNRLDVYTINSFYPEGTTAGATGVNIPSFSVDDGDFVFNDGGYPTAHRLRSKNESLTRYDDKSLTDADGNVYNGYIYSNKSSNADVYVALECKADDIITAIVSSNGKDSDIHFANVDDAENDVFQTYAGGSPATRMEFYPSSNGKYKFYSSNEKLVIGRVYRQHANYGVVSGSVEGYTGTELSLQRALTMNLALRVQTNTLSLQTTL